MTTLPNHKVILGTAAAVILAGCQSTPYVENDTKRLTTPEIHNAPFKVTLAVAASKSEEISPTTNEINIGDGELSLEARMTTGGGTEVFISSGDVEGAGIVYQFFGDNLEASSVGNFSAAMSAGYFRFYSDKGNSDKYTGWEVQQDMIDLSLIAGYRVHDKGLLFSSLFYRGGDIDVTVIPELNQESQNSYLLYPITFTCEELSNSCVKNQFQSHGKLRGLNIGYRHDFYHWLSLTSEVVFYQEDIFGKTHSDQALNLKLGFHF